MLRNGGTRISSALSSLAREAAFHPIVIFDRGASAESMDTGSTFLRPSVDPEEVKKFAKLSSQWWDKGGSFGPLHSMNSVRCRFVQEGMAMLGRQAEDGMPSTSGRPLGYRPLQGLRILDVGCGGGILSEGLARLGADVTGIDVVPENVHVAAAHAQRDPFIRDRIQYRHVSAEELAAEGARFDAVIASEVIEHVKRPSAFAKTLAKLAEPGKGLVFISTLDRSNKSFLAAIVGAEYLSGLVPRGTHDWLQFIRPGELDRFMEASGMARRRLTGLHMGPLSWQWTFTDDTSINYMAMYAWETQHKETKEAQA